MKTKQFKISTWFIRDYLDYKVDILYENETKRAYTGMHLTNGFKENFLLANKIPILKWKTNIMDVAAVAIAKPILPYANRHRGIPILPVLGRIKGGSNL